MLGELRDQIDKWQDVCFLCVALKKCDVEGRVAVRFVWRPFSKSWGKKGGVQ